MSAGTGRTGRHRRDTLLLRASRHPLSAELASALGQMNGMLDARLALLVSGGGDSMAMLVLMAAVRERTDRTLDSLAVLSVDHGLRPEATRECEAAIELAGELGIARREIARVQVRRDGNLLDAARTARLEAASTFTAQQGCAAAMLAHTADDRAESLLMGLSKGLGVSAATRLPARRELIDFGRIVLVRPLLGVTRSRLREFLDTLEVQWHEDPSNTMFERGALRAEPAVARLVEQIAQGASRLSDEVSELSQVCDERRASELGQAPISIARDALDALPRGVLRAALKSLVLDAGAHVPAKTLDHAIDHIATRDRSPLRLGCSDGRELVVDTRGARVLLLRQTVATETIRNTGDNSGVDLQHHR
jgi:tRNA(Ile)-lysidine synthase